MKRFLNNQTTHTTTVIVLITWLFALASGIANACLLEGPGGTHSHAAGVEQSPHSHAHAGIPEQATDNADVSEQSAPTKALCLDACDDRAHAMVKQDTVVDQPHFSLLTIIAFVWLAAQPMESAERTERHNRADVSDVPIRVRYSRLTL